MLEVFFGLAGYSWRAIPEFSTIDTPLIFLTREGKEFYWTPNCQSSFEIFCTVPILVYPDSIPEFISDTDASVSATET